MASPRFTRRPATAGALAAAAAVLALAGCHSSSGAAAGSPSSSASATGAATAANAGAGATTGTPTAAGSGSGGDSYFPAQVGDTWTYTENLDGGVVTVTHKTTAVTHVADGTQVSFSQTTNASGSPQTSTFSYIVRPDGSIAVPLDFNVGSSGDTVTSTGLYWPGPAQLASGQPVDETPVTTMTISGQTTTVTAHAVVKGEGTQSVTVPAGTYTATVVDDVVTEKIEGYTSTFDSKTWLVNGVGPVKEVLTTGTGGDAAAVTEVLTSFTKG
jgi:hypothetical protein